MVMMIGCILLYLYVVLTTGIIYQHYRKFLFFNLIIPLLSHNNYLGALIQFSHGYGHKKYTSFWIHHFCSGIILNFFMFLKISHIYFRGYLIIHQTNEWVLIMCPSRGLKVFPILATASDKLFLLKLSPLMLFHFL